MPMIIVETQTLRAMLNEDNMNVSVFQARNPEAKIHKQWFLLGNGKFSGGIITGSGINCGVLAHLEPLLNSKVSVPLNPAPIVPIT